MRGEDPNRADLLEAALERAKAYRSAGAGSVLAPGLSHPDLIERLCLEAGLPINVMRLPEMASNAELGALAVALISYGPAP